MDRTLVSIIIPMYRVEAVLPDCLDCLCAQTYSDLEVIFIDDCSPDESASLVERYIPRLENKGYLVKLIKHQTNQGVASARNTGLDHATGEYIYYFDADDYLEADGIEIMMHQAICADADIVGCNWLLSYEGAKRRMTQPTIHSGNEAFSKMCEGVLKWNLWLFLVRRSLYEQGEKLRFTPGQNMGEDMMIMGKLFLRAGKLEMIKEHLYHYTKTNAGSLTANYTDAHWAQVDINLRSLSKYVEDFGSDAQKLEIEYLKLNLKLPLLISPRRADYKRWSDWFPESNTYIMANRMLPLRTRLLQLAAKYRLWPLVWLYYHLVMRLIYRFLYK
ncbi:MAG: glycosyltransferase family 2 protein [Porphyromonadaceae bacterium]|nr:glycosyltransferase family 2 protein [Porphyromonadaceae bacterium]